MKKKFIIYLLFCWFIFWNNVYAINSYMNNTYENNFDKISYEVYEMQKLFSWNYNDWVIFDVKWAKSKWYSKESIDISIEMEQITNKIIQTSKNNKTNLNIENNFDIENSSSIIFSNIKLTDYPKFEKFVTTIKKTDDLETVKQSNNTTLGLFDATEICGSFWNHKPTSAAPWSTQSINSLNQGKTILYASGFHPTSDTYGGWWTRPQNYESWICGVGSFRDHASINSSNTILYIQDYNGFTPRWEPNPEINTYTWPYAAWPSYVYYWHWLY